MSAKEYGRIQIAQLNQRLLSAGSFRGTCVSVCDCFSSFFNDQSDGMGKLNVSMLRYLSREDFRVLTAVCMPDCAKYRSFVSADQTSAEAIVSMLDVQCAIVSIAQNIRRCFSQNLCLNLRIALIEFVVEGNKAIFRVMSPFVINVPANQRSTGYLHKAVFSSYG